MSTNTEISRKSVRIRPITAGDISACHSLIGELADYEKAPEEFVLSIEQFEQDLRDNRFEAFVAEANGEILGMALYYFNYSTWKGVSLYLEDLVVREQHRRLGIGSMLFEAVAEMAAEKEVGRFAWQVLDWNESAIDFYKRYPVELESEWLNGKIRKEKLHRFKK